MLEVARFSTPEEPASLKELAIWTGISRRYLEQLVIPLRRAGLLAGRSGRSGGYVLARDPAAIRVGEILGAAMGPLRIVHCVDDAGSCGRSRGCECRLLWVLLNGRMREVLDEFSLGDLADPAWRSRVAAHEVARFRRPPGKGGRG